MSNTRYLLNRLSISNANKAKSYIRAVKLLVTANALELKRGQDLIKLYVKALSKDRCNDSGTVFNDLLMNTKCTSKFSK